MKILFVCTGNTCRSVMAESVMKCLLACLRETGKLREDTEVSSAGISVCEGEKPCDEAVSCAFNTCSEIIEEYGVSLDPEEFGIKNHSAIQITAGMIKESDVILTMTETHKYILKNSLPDLTEKKVFTLYEYVESKDCLKNIPDPYGGNAEIYSICIAKIEKYCRMLAEKLLNI